MYYLVTRLGLHLGLETELSSNAAALGGGLPAALGVLLNVPGTLQRHHRVSVVNPLTVDHDCRASTRLSLPSIAKPFHNPALSV